MLLLPREILRKQLFAVVMESGSQQPKTEVPYESVVYIDRDRTTSYDSIGSMGDYIGSLICFVFGMKK